MSITLGFIRPAEGPTQIQHCALFKGGLEIQEMGPGISLCKTLKGLGLGGCRGHKISNGINWKGTEGKGCPAGHSLATEVQWQREPGGAQSPHRCRGDCPLLLPRGGGAHSRVTLLTDAELWEEG